MSTADRSVSAVLKVSDRGLRQQMASWVDESEAQLDTVVALVQLTTHLLVTGYSV